MTEQDAIDKAKKIAKRTGKPVYIYAYLNDDYRLEYETCLKENLFVTESHYVIYP